MFVGVFKIGKNFYMTIQIDDAGYGSLLGPTFIGAYRIETDEFFFDEVSLKFFRGPIFNEGEYLREATRSVHRLLARLNSPPDEPVEICTGNIFDDVAKSLDPHPVTRKKIEGDLQEHIEGVQQKFLLELGVPVDGIEPSAEHFRACFNWVAEDYRKRERYVKTGWGKWMSKWRPIIMSRISRARRAERRSQDGGTRSE